jgi:hypothetical protein
MPYLEHVGILGMKWGRRKGSTPSSSDHNSVRGLTKKKVHQLSNEELKKVTARLQLEKTYKDLNPSKISAGKKIVNGILIGATTTVATAFVASQMKNVLEVITKAVTKG